MQTTLLGLAIALIIALVAALVGPYFVDWNQFRPQFEAEASQVVGAPVRVAGALEARLLPSPSLRLRSVVVGGANDLGKVRADKLDVEFSLGSLMRGEWRATQLSIDGMALDLGLDPKGAIDWPSGQGKFNLGSLSIDRLHLTGRAALHDALSHRTLELSNIVFAGDVRSLAGALRGDGGVTVSGTRYPFRVSSGQSADGNSTRLHLVVDSSARPLSVELDGFLSFEARSPRFEGTVALVASAGKGDKNASLASAPLSNLPLSNVPWRIAARVKADRASAKLDQIETSYGADDVALKLTGTGELRFGTAPLLHAALSARQLDADRFAAREGTKDGGVNAAKSNNAKPNNAKSNNAIKLGDGNDAADPIRVMPVLRALAAALPETPIPAALELSAEQIVVGGRSVQNFAAELRSDTRTWALDRLDLRAPGTTHVTLSGKAGNATPGDAKSGDASSGRFKGALSVESSDPDALVMWLQGRSEPGYHSQNAFRLNGDVSIDANGVAIDNVKSEIDGGVLEGRVAWTHDARSVASFEAALKAERLDLDAANVFARAVVGPQGEWPERARLSLSINHAISAGQDLHPFAAKFGYDPKGWTLESLKIGEAGGVMLDGNGTFDRTNATGKFALNSGAASLSQLAGAIAPVLPKFAVRLNAMKLAPGPAHLRLALAVDKEAGRADRANAQATIDLDAPQFKGSASISAKPGAANLRDADLDKLLHGDVTVETKLASEQGASLLALLGLDGVIAARDGAAQLQGSVSGAWGTPLRLKLDLTGAGFEAEAQGTADPFVQEFDPRAIKANFSLKARGLNLSPLFDLKPSDKAMQDVGLSTRVSFTNGKVTLDDIDGTIAGSRLRGHVAMTLDGERKIDGEVGLDALELAPAFALIIGAGRDAAEPLGNGLAKGWRGQVAFQALRGVLPGGSELRPLSGTVKGDGQSLNVEGIKGGIGGGDVSGAIEARQTAGGLSLNSRVAFAGVDGSTLHYRALAMPAGRTSLQMTLTSQGRSASALTGAMSGNGTVTLEAARIAGLDPHAFEVAIRASDAGQATDDARLRKIVEPALSGGALLVSSAQIPFTIHDGRLRVSATTLDGEGVRAIVSGGYDIPADQADLRAGLTASGVAAGQASPPEIAIFAAGTPDALNRTVDVAALSSWLAVRAIDRETKRLDSIERGEASPASIQPAQPMSLPEPASPGLTSPGSPSADAPLRPLPPKPRVSVPRSAVIPPTAPAVNAPPANSAATTGAPVVSQQVPPPLPPPIEVRPAPRPARPKPPLVLTPPQPSF
ncbi:AsmA family protein [Bradyrhizobium erythrophlei]|uniref:Large subunit ribosomal protein L24 n=1 Tax=Bradyrhizobium erythrophlei TaxID=1437360 RepID=A0A1M7UBF0_9BRAD|nr:AsmA family protein [Bradyrhizobium erythrophlei]SHN80238.1 large subunit ribosomal protein L24 [Bradyrhizobium erythrophlei]